MTMEERLGARRLADLCRLVTETPQAVNPRPMERRTSLLRAVPHHLKKVAGRDPKKGGQT